MKKIVMIFAAAAIGIGSTFAQIQDQRHPIQPRDNVATGAESIEARVDFLSGKLDLSEEQTAKLTELFESQKAEKQKAVGEYRAQMEKMRDEHRDAMKKMVQEHRDEMEKILTPEQIAAFKALQAARQERRMAAGYQHHGHGFHHGHHPVPQHECPCCGHHFRPEGCPADRPARHPRHHHGCAR